MKRVKNRVAEIDVAEFFEIRIQSKAQEAGTASRERRRLHGGEGLVAQNPVLDNPDASGAQSPELNQADRKWMEEEVSALITQQEIRIFTELRFEEDRERFKELFWRRRDPDLATRENEIRAEVQNRQRTADRLINADSMRGAIRREIPGCGRRLNWSIRPCRSQGTSPAGR